MSRKPEHLKFRAMAWALGAVLYVTVPSFVGALGYGLYLLTVAAWKSIW